MQVAVVGSRSICAVDMAAYIPEGTTSLVTGGAKGVDTLAEQYAKTHGIPVIVIKPDYAKYGRRAPLVRNLAIIDQADHVVALWDGISKGTKYVIDQCHKRGVSISVIMFTH